MTKRHHVSENTQFYKSYKETGTSLVLGLIILTLGLYTINWIYMRNKEFESLDKHAPDSNRGAIILMVLPFAWFFITAVLEKLVFNPNSTIFSIIEILGWSLVIFLVIKYIFDFCISYGKITKTFGILWFILFLIGIIGVISIFLKIKCTIPLVFFLIIVIPAMQNELNAHFRKFNITKSKNSFYQ